jgi:hypothetical protein
MDPQCAAARRAQNRFNAANWLFSAQPLKLSVEGESDRVASGRGRRRFNPCE